MSRRLVVDDRYEGHHGIARYAREVLSRLPLPHTSLGGAYRPGKARDVFNPRRLALSSSDVLYNPGYTAGVSRCVQVVTIHDLIHLHEKSSASPIVRTYYERVVKPAVRRAGHVLTVSRTSASDIAAWLGDDEVAIHNAGNGCSDVFGPEGKQLDLGAPFVAYVGNLKGHKNPDLAFNALSLLPDVKLVVVSPTPEEAMIKADEAGVAHRTVTLSGLSDEQLAEVYRGASALAFPSLLEGFGLPVIEARRCRTPVVYYRGCRSVDEICAGTFAVDDAHDPSEFAATLAQAMTAGSINVEPELAYNWESVASNVRTTLETVLAEG